jgi:formylglycine-generating enzyme required for sulfatase activity
VDTVRAECFDLLRDLEEVDFEVKTAASGKASATKQGSVLYRVPHKMPLRKPTICTVRVAIDEDAILEDIVLDDDVRLRPRVEVSDMMQAELLDPEGGVFSITALSATKQLVRDTGYTQWLFSVTPRVEGEHQLLVKVSMMEFNDKLGDYVPREVSILETITIVTEMAISDSDEPPLKATGEHFSLGPDVRAAAAAPPPAAVLPPSPAPQPSSPSAEGRRGARGGAGLRALAFSLIFLMVGTTATWAFTPQETLDWWETRYWDDTPESYAGYIKKYENTDKKQHLEKAFFYKADKTNALADLRDYQRQYAQGQFLEKVAGEIEAVASIQQQPEAEKIRQFARDFPESERLPALREAAADRAELLPAVEDAYVYSIEAQPSKPKVVAYLRDFPQRERLPEVATAVAAKREVMREVQPELETAFLQKMEKNPTQPQAEAFLQQFPVPTQREKFERILDKKPVLKKQFLQKMEKAAAEQKVREEKERRRAAEEAAEKARLEALQRRAQETKDADERARLEKEAAEEAERQRLEAEARRDTDADGVPDKDDKCPNEKGDAANNGCPTLEPPRERRSGLTMLRVAGGAFTMGDDKDDDIDNCEHSVSVKTFEIGKYEVTQADWREVMGSDPPDLYNKGCDDCPVEGVSWDDVQEFFKTLNRVTTSGKRYRLPTEAEWEFAARGGKNSLPVGEGRGGAGYTYSGSNDLDKVAWYSSNHEVGNTFGSRKTTRPVGTKAPNELGIYDMSGNVYEWCQDKDGPYPGCSEPKETSSYRVCRGGSWGSNPIDDRVAYRSRGSPYDRNYHIGFRAARD